ncbi:MAG: SpoIIE family protein phosphatase [Clostridia bacterium]|nr:SpoIIE family protein phosphatase [Clostridia bacterium]
MKRIKNLVIGGIQSKVFNLILYTVVLLTAAFMAVSIYQNNMLSQLAAESSRQQEEAIGEITGQVMNAVVEQSLARSNRTDAEIADAMFDSAAQRVSFLADCAAKLLAQPENFTAQPYAGPDPADDGKWTAKVIYAEGVDPNSPAVAEKLGLLSNLSETMISLCPAFDASTLYIGLPEGVHLSVSDNSSSWFVDGQPRTYDPRLRGWYQKAVERGTLVFTDGEWDANTGAYCLECAMPVYGPDGTIQAVVGTDLYLTEMERVMQGLSVEGEQFLLVNERGRAVLAPQAEAFPMAAEDREADLRASRHSALAQAVDSALQGNSVAVTLGALADGNYYLAASPIEATGWVLVSAFSEKIAAQPIALLQNSNDQIQREAAAAYQEKTANSRASAIVLFIIVMLLTLGGALSLGKRIVKPLNTITKRISQLSEGDLEFKMEDAYRTGDEVEELAQSFASLSHKTVEYMEKVVQVTAEKERIGAELSLATQIQAAMLPHIVPAFPDRTDFDIIGSMDPAKEVGGDFYDYFLIDDDHLGMVIADVSGKGVPAALFMMASKIILQSIAMMGHSPAKILERTNEAICSNNEAQMFVTVWLGILELSTGKLTCANAGHEYPVFKRPDGNYELYKDRHGFVIGGMEGVKYKEYEVQLEPGAKLFVYTDGVPEATNTDKELFGTDRMMAALNAEPDASPQEVLKNVRAHVDAFVKDAEQFDDLTMLCLEYKGGAKP